MHANPKPYTPNPAPRTRYGSVARQLLLSPDARLALAALSGSGDRMVLMWWQRLMAALAHAAGTSREFALICLPPLLASLAAASGDESRLLHAVDALRWLALQPACRVHLAAGAGMDTLSLLVNALPKWSSRNLDTAQRPVGAGPADVWPGLLETAMSVLRHTMCHALAPVLLGDG